MDSLLRKFCSVLALATAAVTSAFAQAAAPVAGSSVGGNGSAGSVPEFSGIWVHAIPGFEPMPSGPTALVNRSRRQDGTGNLNRLAGDYTNPILTPLAAQIVKLHGALGTNYIGDPNPRNQCR